MTAASIATIRVKPSPGVRVVDPETRRPLPESGASVPRSIYWLRRLADGEVVEIATPPAKHADKPAK